MVEGETRFWSASFQQADRRLRRRSKRTLLDDHGDRRLAAPIIRPVRDLPVFCRRRGEGRAALGEVCGDSLGRHF